MSLVKADLQVASPIPQVKAFLKENKTFHNKVRINIPKLANGKPRGFVAVGGRSSQIKLFLGFQGILLKF